MSRISARAPALLAVALAIVLETLVAGRVAVANGFVAGFPRQTLQQLNDQWLWSGSAVSAPMLPLLALAVFVVLAQLHWRRVRISGGVGCVLLAGLVALACASEPTFRHPVSALAFSLQLLLITLAITLGLAGTAAVAGDIRGPVARQRPPSEQARAQHNAHEGGLDASISSANRKDSASRAASADLSL